MDSLPDEILLRVMSCLGLADRKCVGLTCHRFYEIYLDSQLQQDVVVAVHDNLHLALEALKRSRLPVYRLSLNNGELNGSSLEVWSEVWKQMGNTLTHLTFNNCDVREASLMEVLRLGRNMRELHLVSCDSVFMSGNLLQSADDVAKIKPALINVTTLNLSNNRYVSDCLFNRLVTVAPNIEKLCLSSCQISFHPAIFKRFYPRNPTDTYSEHVLTFQRILTFIDMRGENFSSLDVSRTVIDSDSLINLATLPNLALKELSLTHCDQLTSHGLVRLSHVQRKLRFLDVSNCTKFNDSVLSHVCEHVQELENLHLQSCREITDKGLRELKSLTKLKVLNIGSCENVTANALVEVFNENAFSQFRHLNVRACYLTEMMLWVLFRNMPALQYLDVSCCGESVTDSVLQCIIKNLKFLKHLDLAWCNKITAAGLGAANVPDDAGETLPLTENTQMPISLITGLIHLNLCACPNVGDLSMTAFHFSELQYLNMSLCRLITDVSLLTIGKNVPSLETLYLSQCSAITDYGISKMVEYLPRLKFLDVQVAI